MTLCFSCGGPTESPAVATVAITPSTSTLGLGSALPLRATSQDARGRMLDRPIFWSSNRPEVAQVSPSGVVTALQIGTAQIAASADGISAVATVEVTPVPVDRVVVLPAAASLVVGGSQQLQAVAYSASGLTLANRPFVFSSSNEAVARVDASGNVRGVAVGTAVISATAEGKSGASQIAVSRAPVARVLVTPSPASVIVGQSVQLTATTVGVNGDTLSGRAVTWTSSNDNIASVSQTGVATGKAVGTVVIIVTSENQSGSTQITVAPVPVASVTVTPTAVSLVRGQAQQLTATPRDAGGAALSGRVVIWSTSNAAVAMVSTSGNVTAVGIGSAVITATSEGKSGSATVSVASDVARVQVSPKNVIVDKGQSAQLSAKAFNAAGTELSGRTFIWSSSNDAIATVDQSGLVKGKAAGVVSITAALEGKSDAASVAVVNP
ncbi:MAG: Ig-like domain-containing protein [Gemmatimonadota bacterium]|nr:Ig-like domain-containing protein [Gemmatimonadota bacterium]